MKTHTFSSRIGIIRNTCVAIIILLTLLTLFSAKSYSQTKIYANTVSNLSPNGMSSLVGCGGLNLSPCYNTPTVDNAGNAILQDNTFATVKSSSGLALNIGAYTGELEIKFPGNVPAGTTSYVRINFDADVLNALLGGNLGGLLADVLGGVALGNHAFEVGARNSSGTTVLSGSSTSAFPNQNLRLVKDANGFFYVAITPTATYDRVYVKDITSALVGLNTTQHTDVYYAFYGSGIDPCAQAFTTGYEGTGITLDALQLGSSGVTNSERAIDSDPNNFSQLSLGILSAGSSISQNFYFATPSNPGDDINLRFGTTSALLTAGVLQNISITAYNGGTLVYTGSVPTTLNLDLLGLLNSGQPVSIPFSPGANVVYDRVKVTLGSAATLNLTQTLNVYGVIRSAGRPTPTSTAISSCYNSTVALNATTPNTNELLWYEAIEGGVPVDTVAFNGTFTTPPLTATKTYYVAARRVGCTAESTRIPVVITVNPQIIFNGATLTNATPGFAYAKQLDAATGGTAGYTYALAAGSALPAGLTLSQTGAITGTPTVTGNSTFDVVATDSKGCKATATYNLTVTAALVLTPGALPDGVTGTVYPTQTIPAAIGGTGPYTYSATGVPPGLTFNPTTREITGTPTQPGIYTIPVTVVDANGNTITSNYTVKITDPLLLPTATLANGTTGTAYTTQIIPSATGGTTPYTYSATGLPPGLTFNPSTRAITGTPTTPGTYTVPVTVTDADGKTATTNYSITVNSLLVLPAATLPDGTENVAYATQVLPAATGGVGPYTYVATDLPAGLTFNPTTREVSGTPTQAGNYSIGVTATDSEGRTASNTYALKVIGVLSLPGATLPNGIVDTPYPTQTLPAVTGGTAPYTYLATNLPPGLSFNTATREITGTPTLGGTFTISLTATDANGNKATTAYSLTVTVDAPVVAAATVCAGSSATLSVSNLQAGVTYNWYASTGSTPLVTNNTGVFVTPAVTAPTVFYVEAVSGTAVSSRTAVNVSVNPPATTATVTTNSQVINAGQSTTLLATADAGNTIQWYDAVTGGTQVGAGTSFTTPALSATTTYYVETTNASGCKSASRVPVTVTVLNNGGGTACNAANSQNSGINGICLLCGITSAGNSTDADPSNFTRISLAAGAGGSGYQQLIFPNVGTATDSLRLDLALPTGLTDVGLLNNVTVTVLNGTTVVRTVQLNGGLLNLQLLSGNRFAATILAGGAYDRVQVSFGALVTALTSLDVYGATVIYPNPTVTAGAQTICAGSTATLTATANGGTTLAWYDAATGGTQLGTGETFTTPALTVTTTYYIQVSKGGCPNVTRVPVIVTVTPALPTPVLATIANVCEGSSATLSVANPDAAVTYKWYDAAVGGNLVFTGAVFPTPALTAATTYYVEASQGNCTSTTRAAAAVSVNPRPALPVVTASSSTVSAGQTAILTASSADPTNTFNWYTSNTSTTPVYVGATYVTPPLLATTTYYIESVSTNGCTSASRVQVTITVDGNGSPNPVPCEAATTQVDGVTGVALLSGVFNPTLAIDNDTQTASSLIMPVGALGASVYQRVGFGSLSKVGDTVRVLVSSPGKLLSLSLLGNASVTTYVGTNSNGDSKLLNDNSINIQLLSGNTQALITFVPTNVFDGVEVRLNSGLLGALTSINLNYAQHILVAPTVASANVTACVGQTAQLEVSNPSASLTYRWYDATGTYLTGKDGIIFTTPVLTGDTKFYVAAVSATGCVSYKTVVNVTTNPAPVTPDLLSASVNTCPNTAVTFQVKNPIVGTTYNWYDAAVGGNLVFTGDNFTTPLITANTSYFVAAVNGCGASSTRTEGKIILGTIDVPVITPPLVTISEGSVAVLKAISSTAGATINWYTTVNGLIPVHTGDTYVTPQLPATTTYYVEATIPGGCTATSRATVTVTVIPNGTPITTPCGAATTTVASGVTGVAVLAGVFNPTFAVDNDINTGSSLVIPVGLLGASVYHQVGFTGLSNVGDTLRMKITTPGALLSVGVLNNLTVTTFQGTTSNNDAVSISNPLISLKLLPGGTSAILTFVPTSKFDGAELRLSSGLLGALTSVNLDYAQRVITTPTVTAATASACQGSSATLGVQNPQAGVVYKWYLGTTYQAGKDGATFTTDPALTLGTYTYSVTATANGCETLGTKVVVTILAPPVAPIPSTTNPATTCIGSPATLSVQAVAGITYNWYDAATGGNMLVTNNSSFITSASLAAGTYDYYVEAVSGTGCSNSTRTKVSIIVNPSAVAADVTITGTTSLCASGTAVLTAASTTVTSPVFTWYTDAALTQVAFVGAVFNTPAITATTKYYVTVSGTNKCANTAGNAKEVMVTVNPVATAAAINLAGTSTVCGSSSVTLNATSTTVTNPVFTWYSDAALTTVAFTGANFITPALNATTTYYVTVKGDNKCENTAATAKSITITVNPSATDSDIAINGIASICKGSTAALSASTITVINPVFTWYSNAALTTVAHVGASFTTPALNATTTYYVTVKGDNKCENLAANAKVVTVTVKEFATSADIAVSNAQICSGSTVMLMASSTTVTQPVFTWYSDASLTSVVFTGPTFTVTGLTATTTYYVTVKGANRCENSAADAKVVTITVNPLATTTDIILSGSTAACAGSSAALTATSATVTNPVFTWYSDAALTNVSFIGATYTTPALNSTTTYYVTVKGDNKCENTAATARAVAITVNALPNNPVVSVPNGGICAGDGATLTVTNTQAGVTYEWYTAAVGGNLLFTGTIFNVTALAATTDYYILAIGTGGCNNNGGRVIVTVTVNAKPTVPTVASTSVNVCTGSPAVLTVTSPQTGVTYNWYTVAVGGTLAGTGVNFTTPAVNANITYYVEGANGTCISSSRTPVNVIALPVPVAPASVTAANGRLCAGSSTILTVNNPVTGLVYRWYAASSGGPVLAEGITFTTPNLTATTIYYVEAIAVGGCASPTRTGVTVNVLPVLEKPVVVVQSTTPNSVTFAWAVVAGATAYEVSQDNGLTWVNPTSGSTGTTYLVAGLKPDQSVTIIVRARGQLECQTSANSTPVTGKAANPFGDQVYIPNAFTPNNDGKNDTFLIYGNTISSAKMSIFTQWGQLIFQSDNVANGWDGTFKGVNQPIGVYAYMVDITFTNGTTSLRKGTVTLIR
ncbi:gliding motility-associated C-terminal domain-containing protein [Pedobacter borealis]|uniref:gliding motility-associated C-terminal domain-containing protein n=1 Tax=Pedobacter borealis TaxID=475254 RepID=UPI001428A328|nr:gliding motility-associated C-terminal domain-containing protein [Pedobacter borealis]